jgi:uncharacterized protein (TIRG00374 family)
MKILAALSSRSALLGLVVGLPVSSFFLWLAVRNADFGKVGSVLAESDVGLVAAAVAAVSVMFAAQAVRWRLIVQTTGVSYARFGEMVVSGVAVNNILPGRVGDALRARWLQVAGRISGGRALANVFLDRGFDVLALVLFLLLSLPFVAGAEWLRPMAVGGVLLLTALGLARVAARAYTSHRGRERRNHRSFLRRVARDALEGLADPLGRLRAIALAGLSLGAWAMWALSAWFVAQAVGIELSLVEAIFVTAVINLGSAIPSSPGFIGTHQWLAVSALAVFAVGTDEALAFAILMHAVWYVPTTLVGGAMLLGRSVGAIGHPAVRSVTLAKSAEA